MVLSKSVGKSVCIYFDLKLAGVTVLLPLPQSLKLLIPFVQVYATNDFLCVNIKSLCQVTRF